MSKENGRRYDMKKLIASCIIASNIALGCNVPKPGTGHTTSITLIEPDKKVQKVFKGDSVIDVDIIYRNDMWGLYVNFDRYLCKSWSIYVEDKTFNGIMNKLNKEYDNLVACQKCMDDAGVK